MSGKRSAEAGLFCDILAGLAFEPRLFIFPSGLKALLLGAIRQNMPSDRQRRAVAGWR
jgi:hypothetical protein